MSQQPAHIAAADIADGLRSLGVCEGDTVFVHASMRKFGHVEGEADAVIDALINVVGHGGTVAMPGFSFQLNPIPEPTFDVRNTPTWTGKIYETFRTCEGVRRSHHVTHSVCALGARARELTATHSVTPCGVESPFPKLAAWGAKIVFFGVSLNCNTTFHAVEEQEHLFYCGFRELSGATIIDEAGDQHPIPAKVHDMARQYDFNRMAGLLEELDIMQAGLIGDAITRVVEADAMYEATVAAVRNNAAALLRQGDTYCFMPTCRAELAHGRFLD